MGKWHRAIMTMIHVNLAYVVPLTEDVSPQLFGIKYPRQIYKDNKMASTDFGQTSKNIYGKFISVQRTCVCSCLTLQHGNLVSINHMIKYNMGNCLELYIVVCGKFCRPYNACLSGNASLHISFIFLNTSRCVMKSRRPLGNIPDGQILGSTMGAHLRPTGPRWAPYWLHEPCYLGIPYSA